MKLRWLIIFVWAGIALGCGEGKAYDFSTDKCGGSENAQLNGLYGKSDGAATPEATCVYYEVTGASTVHIDISRLAANCSGPMGGTVTAEGDNGFSIEIEQEDCNSIAWCSCPYDFSFDISDVDVQKDMVFALEQDQCNSNRRCFARQTLPLDTAPRGIACAYYTGETVSMENKVCSEDDDCGSEEYACVPATPENPSDKKCLKKCKEDAGCPGDGIYLCNEQNVCVLANPLTPCSE